MIEFSVHQPSFGNLRRRDRRNQFAARLHFVAIRTAGIQRAARRRFRRVAEKNLPLQFFTAVKFLAQRLHLSLDKFFDAAIFGHARFAREVGILNFQTTQKGADRFRISMRQLQSGIVFVELKGMTFAAIRFKGNFLVKRAGRVGLVAVSAIKFAAVFRFHRIAQMQAMIKPQRVRIFQILRVNLKIGMSICE